MEGTYCRRGVLWEGRGQAEEIIAEASQKLASKRDEAPESRSLPSPLTFPEHH